MASLIYDSALYDEARGNINYLSDSFKVILVTSTYVPNKGTHLKRSDVTNEVVGTGYVAGGQAATVAVGAVDTTNHRVDVSLGGTTWSTATITARGAVYYKSRGGAATADELIAYIDFGADITSTGANFALTASTLRKSNP